MVRQVMLTERFFDGSQTLTRPVIAFGSHPDATPNEQHSTLTAVAANQRIRVVIDELLVGNELEEIQCTEQVDEDDFSRVPRGATPDDIARCAVVKDQLAQSCRGPNAVCLRASDGQPVGVLDEVDTAGRPYKDGIADTTRFIDGAAGVLCGDRSIPLNLARSYWQPSGNQQRPAIDDGFRGLLSLGPAVVLVPTGFLPTDEACTIVFGERTVDKSDLRPCAPAAGDLLAGCTPGDTSEVTFRTEPMQVLQQVPTRDAVGVSRTADLSVRANVAFGPDPLVESVPAATFVVSSPPELPQVLTLRPAQPLASTTRYEVSVRLRDSFGRGPSTPARLTFTTGN